MSKPIGPICNLDCSYCFYLEKEEMYVQEGRGRRPSWQMSDEVLETYIRQYIQQQDADEINFAWQGGEPTLLGVEFFRKAVTIQQKYAEGKTVHNALQGTAITRSWESAADGRWALPGTPERTALRLTFPITMAASVSSGY